MKWYHIMDSQPINDREIVQVDRPYEGHYTMGMRKYYMGCTMQEFLKWRTENDLPNPDFWWMYAEDFPWPDKSM